MANANRMKVVLTRSMHGRPKGHMESVRGLGLRRMHQVVEVEDTPATRGMVAKVCYMVKVVGE